MSTDPSARTLYVWGWWAWYYRAIALVVYVTCLLLVGLYFPARDLLRQPSFGNLLLFALLSSIAVVWVLLTRMTWRDGQSRATRIDLTAANDAIHVRTLNFGSRHIPLADLENVQYYDLKPDGAEYQEPTLSVHVRGGRPLSVDLEGRILDEQTFKTIFRMPKNPIAIQRKSGQRKV